MITQERVGRFLEKHDFIREIMQKGFFFSKNPEKDSRLLATAISDFVRAFGRGWFFVSTEVTKKERVALYKKLAGKRVKKCKNQRIALEIFDIKEALDVFRRGIRFAKKRGAKANDPLTRDIKLRLASYKKAKREDIKDAIKNCIRAENLEVFFLRKNSVKTYESAPDWNYYAKSVKYPKIHHYTTVYFKWLLKKVYANLELVTADDVLVLPESITSKNELTIMRGKHVKNGRGYNAYIGDTLYVVRDDITGITYHHGNLKRAIAGLCKKIELKIGGKLTQAEINKIAESDAIITVNDSYAVGNCKVGTLAFIKRHGLPPKMLLRDFLPIAIKTDHKGALEALIHAAKRAGIVKHTSQ